MHNVLVVYKQISMRFDEEGNLLPYEGEEPETHTVSYDEKPGIQAIATTSPDLPPREGNGAAYRDYEYVRHGTLSLLAGLDLITGEAIPLVRETHKSSDFIDFLKILDNKYPKGDKIRMVLDNHSAHTSKETRSFLATIPGRFEFVFTPKHGSWLNMIEGFFGKMTNQMLRGIRVHSKEELSDRIYKYFDEVNAAPVVHHWKYKMDEIDPNDKVTVGLSI
jgi:transposase